jgi:uncharacterized protein (TIGR03118 family)
MNYHQLNLNSSNGSYVPNTVRNPNNLNPWGVVENKSNIYVANNGTDTINVYNKKGQVKSLITLDNTTGIPIGPTGLIWNNCDKFVVTFNNTIEVVQLLICTENGSLYGWSSKISTDRAFLIFNNTNSVYKGITILKEFLYLTNFYSGYVEKYNSSFNLVTKFSDIDLINIITANTSVNNNAHYAPFGIAAINDNLYVSFAQQNDNLTKDVPGIGNGFVDIFDYKGNMISRFLNRSYLNSPWALLKIKQYGRSYLMIGNSGDGIINLYDISNGTLITSVKDSHYNNIINDSLWGLVLHKDKIYFTAGIVQQNEGLLGILKPIKNKK